MATISLAPGTAVNEAAALGALNTWPVASSAHSACEAAPTEVAPAGAFRTSSAGVPAPHRASDPARTASMVSSAAASGAPP